MLQEDPLISGIDSVTNCSEEEDIIDGSLVDVTASSEMYDQTDGIGLLFSTAISAVHEGEVEVQSVNECELARVVRDIDQPGAMSEVMHKVGVERFAVISVVPEGKEEAKPINEWDLFGAKHQVDVELTFDGEIGTGFENEVDQAQPEGEAVAEDLEVNAKVNAVHSDYEMNVVNPEMGETPENDRGLGQITSCDSTFRCDVEYLEECEGNLKFLLFVKIFICCDSI